MKVAETTSCFRALLVEGGVDPERLDLRGTWHALKRFAVLPVEDVDATMDGDQLSFDTRYGRRTRRDGGAGSAYPDEPMPSRSASGACST
jgi:hypothetical protein